MVQQRYQASEQVPVSLTGNRQLSSRPTALFLRARLSASDVLSPLLCCADSGYQGAGATVRVPFCGKHRNLPSGQQAVSIAHARIRAVGEQAMATLKSWRLLRKLRCVGLPLGVDPEPHARAGATWWLPDFEPGIRLDTVRGVLREGPAG